MKKMLHCQALYVPKTCHTVLISILPLIFLITAIAVPSFCNSTEIASPITASNTTPPVQFLEFTVTRNENYIQLKWRTAEEESTSRYYIEYSEDGIHWKDIGFLAAKTQASYNEYKFIDHHPEDTLVYYRIRQETIDGIKSHSLTRMIHMKDNPITVVLYPVPANDILKVSIRGRSEFKATGTLRIMDADGKLISKQTIDLASNTSVTEINTSQYKPGVYIMFIRNRFITWTGTFIKE